MKNNNTVGYTATVYAKEGLLLGGGRTHTSSSFERESDAKAWADAVIGVNERAGRKIEKYEIKKVNHIELSAAFVDGVLDK